MLLPLGGRNLYYDLLGSEKGPVVCFAHCLAGDSGIWAEQLPVLIGTGFRVLRIDARGHGGSDAVPGDYTMEQLADDVAAVIDALDIGQVHYVGTSLGGMFGQAFALRHGDKVKSLILCDAHPASGPNAKEKWRPRVAAVKQANSLLPIADTAMTGGWLSDRYKQANPGRWKQIRDTVLGTTPQGFYGCVAAMVNFDFIARLPSVTAPTLVMGGTDAHPGENQYIADLLPNARSEEIAGARHLSNVEFPEIFNRIMMDWLNAYR